MYAAGRLMPPPQILDEFYGGRPATVNTAQPYGRNLRRVRGMPPGTVPLPGTAGGLLPVRRQPSLTAKRRLVQRLVMSGAGWPHGATAEPAYVRRVEVIGELPSYEEAPMQLRALQVGRPAGRVDGFLTSGIGETPHHVTRRRRWLGAQGDAMGVGDDDLYGDDDGLGIDPGTAMMVAQQAQQSPLVKSIFSKLGGLLSRKSERDRNRIAMAETFKSAFGFSHAEAFGWVEALEQITGEREGRPKAWGWVNLLTGEGYPAEAMHYVFKLRGIESMPAGYVPSARAVEFAQRVGLLPPPAPPVYVPAVPAGPPPRVGMSRVVLAPAAGPEEAPTRAPQPVWTGAAMGGGAMPWWLIGAGLVAAFVFGTPGRGERR